MASDTPKKLHEVVDGILADLETIEGTFGLTQPKVRKWIRVVTGHPERRDIAAQLIAAAKRLRQKRSTTAASQLIVISTYATAPPENRSTLDPCGFKPPPKPDGSNEYIDESETVVEAPPADPELTVVDAGDENAPPHQAADNDRAHDMDTQSSDAGDDQDRDIHDDQALDKTVIDKAIFDLENKS